MPDAPTHTPHRGPTSPSERSGVAARGLRGRWWPRSGPTQAGPDATLEMRVFAARGIDLGRAEQFLEPSLKQLHDPSLIPDLDKAAARLLRAARAGEPIVVYGDYDVDGVTATAILFHTLRLVAPGCRVSTYVPHRLEEGYGLNTAAVEELARGGARVIVSVDCGITAIGPADAARAAGVDLIITDHHNPPASERDLPDAFAVVHPRHPASRYPFGDLCGAGVAFKVAWRLATLAAGAERAEPSVRALLIDLLALAALGVIADVVPLVGENRVIARTGLSRIKHSPLVGLRALVEASGLSGESVDAEQVGFQLAPRLNACGRMGHAADAVEMFTTADAARAAEIAAMLCRQNDQRKETERAIFEQACAMAEAAGFTGPGVRAIVLAHEGWHPGVVGIVCSRLVERYARPAILLSRKDGLCHGSGRSVPGVSLHAALESCGALMESFGGHDMAAGLKVREDRLDALRDGVVAYVNQRLPEADLATLIEYDTDASLSELTAACVTRLQRLAPFGQGNPSVRLRLRGIRLARPAETFGRLNKHLSLRVGDAGGARPLVRLVAWNWADRRDRFTEGAPIEALVSPKINTWNGRSSVECDLIDAAV